MDLRSFGSHKLFTWTHDYLLKYIATGKNAVLTKPLHIQAFKRIDRADFVPVRSKPRAYEDVAVNIGYGENLTRPSVLAYVLEIMDPKVGGVYLDIGSGTGYFASILAKTIGEKGRVYSLERVQWLWETCKINIAKYPDIKNLEFLYRDGLDGLKDKAPFNGIHVSFNAKHLDKNTITTLKKQLKVGNGIMLLPVGQDIKVIKRTSVDNYSEEVIPTGFLFDEAKEGLA